MALGIGLFGSMVSLWWGGAGESSVVGVWPCAGGARGAGEGSVAGVHWDNQDFALAWCRRRRMEGGCRGWFGSWSSRTGQEISMRKSGDGAGP